MACYLIWERDRIRPTELKTPTLVANIFGCLTQSSQQLCETENLLSIILQIRTTCNVRLDQYAIHSDMKSKWLTRDWNTGTPDFKLLCSRISQQHNNLRNIIFKLLLYARPYFETILSFISLILLTSQ